MMCSAALNLFKFYRKTPVSLFSPSENVACMGLRIFTNNYGTDISKQKEFHRAVESWDNSVKKQKTSKAMKAYLERAKKNDEFMKQQEISYQIGKRHLANMMGEDPATFTQDDVDRSIEYLFPSGLYDKRAKPIMKPPKEIFPARKAAEFDESGRPHNFLFYTGKPAFYGVLYDAVTYMKELEKYQDTLISKKIAIDQNTVIPTSGYKWMNKEELETCILETIMDPEYTSFVQTMERLMNLPYSEKYADFVNRFRKALIGQTSTFEIPKPQFDENGRAFVTTYECLRKAARGHVTIRSPGTGVVNINGKDITYFQDIDHREQILFPLLFTDMVSKVDIECFVEGGGPSGQAGALRWGIAWTLRSFVDMETVEKLRLAGLLTRDRRLRERKQPARRGARKLKTWKKR